MNGIVEMWQELSERWMALLFPWSWQALLVIAAAAVAAKTDRGRTAAARHFFWLIVAMAVSVLPALSFLARSIPLPQPLAEPLSYVAQISMAVEAPSLTPAPVVAELSTASLILGLLFAAWTGGLVVIVLRLFASHVTLRQVRGSARRVVFPGIPIPVGYTPEVQTAVLAGLFQPMILLPEHLEEWATEEERRAVMLHELAHFKRRDHYTNFCQTLLAAIFFFHPAVRYARRQLTLEREMACDERVLAGGIRPSLYVDTLLKVAERGIAPLQTQHPAFNSSREILERRMDMILNSSRRSTLSVRRPRLHRWGGLLRIAAVFGFMTFVLLPQPAATAESQAPATPTATPLGNALNGQVALRLPAAAVATAVPQAAPQAPPPAPVQTGRILVRVLDASGAVVPGVRLTLTGLALPTPISSVTNGTGNAVFPQVSPGSHDLRAELPGFLPFTRTSLAVQSGRDTPVDITLTVGSIATLVEVSTSRRALRAATAPTPPPPSPTPVRVGGEIQQANLIFQVKPVYPAAALQGEIQDYVMLQGIINKEGRLVSLKALRPLDPSSELVKAAMEAVAQWRYTPTTLNRVPIEALTTITVNFTLTD